MTLTERVLAGISMFFSFLAAYFAWQNYRARPKLKLFVGDDANKIYYEENLAYVHATLANVGKRAAADVQGRVEFQPAWREFPEKGVS